MGLDDSLVLDGNVIASPEVLRGQLGGAHNLPNNIHSNALASSQIVKTGQGLLYGFTVNNTKVASQFILVFDSATLPANGTVPAVSLTVAASNVFGVNWIPARTFLTGIVIANSSTADTLTLGGADCFFDVQFI